MEDSDNRQLFNWFCYKRKRRIEQELKESDVKGNLIWGLNSLCVADDSDLKKRIYVLREGIIVGERSSGTEIKCSVSQTIW